MSGPGERPDVPGQPEPGRRLDDAEVDERFASIVRDFGPAGAQRWRTAEPLDLDQLGSGATDEPVFVPPEPGPLPTGDPFFWMTVGSLTLGPLLMLWGFILDSDDGGTARWLGVALTVAGTLLLLARLPREQERPDDPDDGAVV